MNKWMKTYWRTRHQGGFWGNNYEELETLRSELVYAKKINDTDAINKIKIVLEPTDVLNIENPTPQMLSAALKLNGWLLCDLIEKGYDITEDLQLNAVLEFENCHGYCIQCIKNPSEKVQIEAVNLNEDVIGNIENPTEKVQLIAVNKFEDAIHYIKNPTEKVKKLAWKKWKIKYH